MLEQITSSSAEGPQGLSPPVMGYLDRAAFIGGVADRPARGYGTGVKRPPLGHRGEGDDGVVGIWGGKSVTQR